MNLRATLISTIIGGFGGAVGWASVFGITEWLFLPDAKKPLALFSATAGGLGGLVVGAIIGLVVVLTNSGTIRSAIIGAGMGMVVAGIHLYQVGQVYTTFYVPPIYILRGVMLVAIAALIAWVTSSVK